MVLAILATFVYPVGENQASAAGDTTHAIWNDSTDSNNWKYIAKKAANAVLSENPNALVMAKRWEIR